MLKSNMSRHVTSESLRHSLFILHNHGLDPSFSVTLTCIQKLFSKLLDSLTFTINEDKIGVFSLYSPLTSY